MTHVSRYKMKRTDEQKIANDLVRTLLTAPKRNQARILKALLTSTERIMLAKRLTLVVMLEKDFSYYRIAQYLKISTSTIKRIHRDLEAGRFAPLQTTLRSKSGVSFMELLEIMMSAGPYGASPEKRRRMADIKRRLWE